MLRPYEGTSHGMVWKKNISVHGSASAKALRREATLCVQGGYS